MPEFIRRLNLTDRECAKLAERIAAQHDGYDMIVSRRYDTHAYHVADIPICVEHPEGGKSYFLVFGRSLAQDAFSFFHGGYVHPGSKCVIMLRALDGEPVGISGSVRFCRIAAGLNHEIGVIFKEEIDINAFLSKSAI